VDDIDRTLLGALLADARTSYADLARTVGLSAPSVHDRVKRLERDGVLRGSTVDIDAKAVGLGVSALVGLQQREGIESDDVVAGLRAIPGIEEVNIGHSVIADAVLFGLERAVRDEIHADVLAHGYDADLGTFPPPGEQRLQDIMHERSP